MAYPSSFYWDAMAGRGDPLRFNGEGVSRWPHHEFIFIYPAVDHLGLDEELLMVPPLGHEKREEPTLERCYQTGMFTLSSLSLIDIGSKRHRLPVHTTNLSKALDTESRAPGSSIISMLTFRKRSLAAGSSAGPLRFRITLQHVNKKSNVASRAFKYEFGIEEFYALHDTTYCAVDCRHWWHNLEDLYLRKSNIAYLQTQEFALSRQFTLPTYDWSAPKQHESTARSIAEEYEKYFLCTLWEGPSFAGCLKQHVCGILSYDEVKRRAREGKAEVAKPMSIDKDALIPGIQHLIDVERMSYIGPERLSPMYSNEAFFMMESFSVVIEREHGNAILPKRLSELLLMQVLEDLAFTAMPPLTVWTPVPGDTLDDWTECAELVKLHPAFSHWLGRFIVGYVHWCWDPDRKSAFPEGRKGKGTGADEESDTLVQQKGHAESD